MIAVSKPVTDYRWAPIDYRGLVLIVSGVALSRPRLPAVGDVGLEQPGDRALHRRRAWLCSLRSCFVELRTASPLMQVRIFRIRAFAVENLVLGIAMLVFIPVFFFASEYAQIALGKSAQQAGLYLLYFFLGFVVTSQIGGRILDRSGAKRPVVIGCALAAVGFALWAGKVTQLDFSNQVWPVILAGAGMGFMLTPANTDAVNRASRLSYGEATGITQTVRNYAASLGFAILGTILVTQLRSRVTSSLIAQGVRPARAAPRHRSSGRPRTPGPARPPFPTSSGSTSPTPPGPSSTSWPASWPPRPWWPSWGSNAASRSRPTRAQKGCRPSGPARPRPRRRRHGRRHPGRPKLLLSLSFVAVIPGLGAIPTDAPGV